MSDNFISGLTDKLLSEPLKEAKRSRVPDAIILFCILAVAFAAGAGFFYWGYRTGIGR